MNLQGFWGKHGGHSHFCHVEPAERSAEGRLLPTGRKTSLRCQEYVKKTLGWFSVCGKPANRQTGKPFGKSIVLWRINEKRIYILYLIYIKYNYYTTLLHAPYHENEKTKWFAGLPVCRYAINIYTCKERVIKIRGLRMDKLERAKGVFLALFSLDFRWFCTPIDFTMQRRLSYTLTEAVLHGNSA